MPWGTWGWTFWPGMHFGGGSGPPITSEELLDIAAGEEAGLLPIDILLDDDEDAVITDDLHFATGITAIAQACRSAMQDTKGEWFLDLDQGLDYWGVLLGQKYDKAKVQAEFRRALLTVPGVKEITALTTELERTTRTLMVKWTVTTDLGIVFADGGSFKEILQT
jgi:hypothetical protein